MLTDVRDRASNSELKGEEKEFLDEVFPDLMQQPDPGAPPHGEVQGAP